MPGFLTELPPMEFDLTTFGTPYVRAYDPRWHTCMGVPQIDFMLDARNVTSIGAVIEIIPLLQFAETRTDRPGSPLEVTGTPLAADNLGHFPQPLTTSWSGASQFYVRRGVAIRLATNGTFGRARGLLYTSFRNLGLVLPAEEIVVQPTNSTADVSIHPIGGGKPIPASKIDKFKQVVIGQGDWNSTMNVQMAVRFFNDPLARGDWSLLESAAHTPATTNFAYNTGEVALSTASPAITAGDFQWYEVGLAVWKTVNTNNSRCILRVLTAMSYT